MNEKSNERLSALVDGEAGDLRGPSALADVLDDINGRRRWERYHLIKQSMKGELPARIHKDFAAGVMARIEAESTLEPTEARKVLDWRGLLRPMAGFAIAASVAVVAVVTWQDLDKDVGEPQIVAQSPIGTTDPGQAVRAGAPQGMRWDHQQPAVESRLNTLLVNHAEYGSGRIQGMLPHARVVGYDQSR